MRTFSILMAPFLFVANAAHSETVEFSVRMYCGITPASEPNIIYINDVRDFEVNEDLNQNQDTLWYAAWRHELTCSLNRQNPGQGPWLNIEGRVFVGKQIAGQTAAYYLEPSTAVVGDPYLISRLEAGSSLESFSKLIISGQPKITDEYTVRYWLQVAPKGSLAPMMLGKGTKRTDEPNVRPL